MFFLPPPPRQLAAQLALRRPAPPSVPNPLILKAQKNFDLSTDCVHLLSSEKYKKLNGRTIKLLLSQHTKKNPFAKLSLGPKVPPLAKIIGRNVKSFSYHTDNQHPDLLKPETRLLKLIAHSYKHLECLDVSKLNIQNRSSYYSISKLNHLQSLNMRLNAGKTMPGPRFLQNLRHLRHLTLFITEPFQNEHTDLVELSGFLYHLTLLPSLESYSINIRTPMSDKNEQFVGTLLYYISLLKAKRFCVKLQCSEGLDLKVEMFSSFLEKIDTLEYKYARDAPILNVPVDFQVPTSRKLILLLGSSQRRKEQSFTYIINACTSLEHLYLEQGQTEAFLTTLILPQALKTLIIRLVRIPSPQHQRNFWEKFWEDALSSMKNLENLGFSLHNPDKAIQQWISRLPQRIPLKGLKQYHLTLREDDSLRQGEYMSFFTEWAQSLKDLSNLESLSLDITFLFLSSLDFFTEALASLQQLKRIKLDLTLDRTQTKEALKLTIPSQNLSKLEHIGLGFFSQYISQDSAAKLLQDIVNCENLQSFNVSGLAFGEQDAISALKKLTHLKKLQIETNTKHTLRLNSKKEFVKCKPMLVSN